MPVTRPERRRSARRTPEVRPATWCRPQSNMCSRSLGLRSSQRSCGSGAISARLFLDGSSLRQLCKPGRCRPAVHVQGPCHVARRRSRMVSEVLDDACHGVAATSCPVGRPPSPGRGPCACASGRRSSRPVRCPQGGESSLKLLRLGDERLKLAKTTVDVTLDVGKKVGHHRKTNACAFATSLAAETRLTVGTAQTTSGGVRLSAPGRGACQTALSVRRR